MAVVRGVDAVPNTVYFIMISAPDIGRELGLKGADEEWPGIGPQMAITFLGAGPAHGMTFYVQPGTSLAEVRKRFEEKLEEFSDFTIP